MHAPPWSAAERRAALGLAALLLGSLPFLVHAWYDPVNDAAMYIATARSLAALDFEPRRGWDRLQEGHQRRLEKARALRAHLAPDDRVAAVAGLHDSVYLERSIWGLHWAIRDAGDPAAAEPIIDKYAIDTVLVGDSKRGRELAAYLEQRYGEPERAGSVRLWRVRP